MTLIHHVDHLARVVDKRVLRYEVPFTGPDCTAWRMIEEFDTTAPILPGMPENYIERIVSEFVNAAAMLRFATFGIEGWANS